MHFDLGDQSTFWTCIRTNFGVAVYTIVIQKGRPKGFRSTMYLIDVLFWLPCPCSHLGD